MRVCLSLTAMVLFVLPAGAVDDKVADRLWEASKVVDELIKAPDSDIPKDLLKRAECVAVIPGLKKAAFGFGGQIGRGAVSLKGDVLRPDKDANKSLYNRQIDVKELVETGVAIPESAKKFVQSVSQAASK